jgi:hypothetical protein
MARHGERARTEHQEQCDLIAWTQFAIQTTPELELLFAIPNGGHRHISVAIALRDEGVKAGVPDLMLPVARDPYHGLFIEMKTQKGRVSSKQKRWIKLLKEQGYRVDVCRCFEEARAVLCDYLEIDLEWAS